MPTKDTTDTFDNGILNEAFAIEPTPETKRNINAINGQVKRRPRDVFG
jgi:hypothetical protein